MNTANRRFLILLARMLLCVPMLLALPATASAYADPGTGTFIYQGICAALLGASFYLKRWFGKLGGRKRK